MENHTQLSKEETVRYDRNLKVPQIGRSGQLLLKNASVMIVGTGGLGSASTLYLAAAGIGRIGIVDSDQVELSNLQRQILHATSNIGEPKVSSAKKKLLDLNPNITIETFHTRISEDNAKNILKDFQIVVDATDNFETRYVVNDACVELGKPFIFGAVFQFYGQMGIFDARKNACLRCIFKNTPDGQTETSFERPGIVSPLPGLIGTLQAIEVIKIILNTGKPTIGRLLLFDGLDMSFQEIHFQKDPACPVCGEGK
jgi:molybdopterin/thiamine biosynthesis adenylyltransferase